MKSTDEKAFAIALSGCLQVVYEKPVTPAVMTVWFGCLQPYELADVQAAFARHVTDPQAGQYPPKPADIIRHLQPRAGDDGHPGADEAWGLLLRLIRDERETGVLSDEMRAGWAICQPILDLGDEVGARKCFIEVYTRHVQEARQSGVKAHWTATLGTDPKLRLQRLQEAVAARRISADHAHSLLPGPTPASLEQVAALLTGPDAPISDRQASQRLRELAAMIRNGMIQAEDKRQSDRQRRIEAERQQKQSIARLIEQRQDKPQQGANP